MKRVSFPFGCRRRHASALLLALGAIVLLSVVIIAFFSRTQINRLISYSGTNMIKADQLARSSMELVTGELRNEIADSAYSQENKGQGGGFYPIYIPFTNSASSFMPQKVGLPQSSTNLACIISKSGSKIDPGGNGRTMGSGISIDAASLNGRYIDENRWYGAAGPNLGDPGSGYLPTWVYVTSSGIQTSAQASDLAGAADPTSPNHVLGRFAYTVYDIGGLLDANVAGVPPALAGVSLAGSKPSLAFADVATFLNIGGLPAWRNTRTGADGNAYAEWGAGIAPNQAPDVNNMSAAASGNLSAVAGDNAFFSRQDLIQAATSATGSQITGLNTASLVSLTHFSRAVNAPSLANAASNPGGINPNLAGDVRFSLPTSTASIVHYNDQGIRADYSVRNGDPLLQSKFSLAKLAWITSRGPAAGISNAAISYCFGLTWDGDNERWTYSPVGASGIDTLAQVAAETREPNFFELLKAGIGSQSLGLGGIKNSANYTCSDFPNQNLLDVTPDLQILRIGANIVDEVSADNFPTTILMTVGSLSLPVYGVKNLPYILGAELAYYSVVNAVPGQTYKLTGNGYTGTGTEYETQHLAVVMLPVLFNPYAPESDAGTRSGPASLRVYVREGGPAVVGIPGEVTGAPLYRSGATPMYDMTGESIIIGNYSSAADPWRSRAYPISDSIQAGGIRFDSNSEIASILDPAWGGAVQDPNHGLLVYDYDNPKDYGYAVKYSTLSAKDYYFVVDNGTGGLSSDTTFAYAANPAPVLLGGNYRVAPNPDIVVDLQYLSPKGVWRTYDTLCGNDGLADAYGNGTGLGAAGSNYSPLNGNTIIEFEPAISTNPSISFCLQRTTLNANSQVGYVGKIDPRTSRAGAGLSNSMMHLTPFSPTANMFNTSSYAGIRSHLPFGAGSLNTRGILPAFWVQGGTQGYVEANAPSPMNVADPDGVVRPADGWLGAAQSGTAYTVTPGPANFFNNLTGTTAAQGEAAGRPVILGRPFQSVAELGYVFRDNYWKTLSFFDQSSADGALLDLFSVTDQPSVVAGRVEMSAAIPQSQEALVSGASQASDGTVALPNAAAIAQAFQAFNYSGGNPTANYIYNAALLPNFMSSTGLVNNYPVATSAVKGYRESVVRALTGGTQSRTWNLLIDLVAQVGRFPAGKTPTDLGGGFNVEGEKRYWLSVAIDRYTGKIVDEQWEPVNAQ